MKAISEIQVAEMRGMHKEAGMTQKQMARHYQKLGYTNGAGNKLEQMHISNYVRQGVRDGTAPAPTTDMDGNLLYPTDLVTLKKTSTGAERVKRKYEKRQHPITAFLKRTLSSELTDEQKLTVIEALMTK